MVSVDKVDSRINIPQCDNKCGGASTNPKGLLNVLSVLYRQLFCRAEWPDAGTTGPVENGVLFLGPNVMDDSESEK